MLRELEARDFRNLEPLHCAIGAGAHLVCGDNGAGKTSLIEAIYLLATTRSFRTSQTADCRRHGSKAFTLRGEVESAQRSRLELTFQQRKIERRVNGARVPLSQHLAVLPVVCWTRRDREILVGAPAERRRFIDRGITGLRPASLEVLTRYRRALDGKRRLLNGGRVSLDELRSWNQVLADAAAMLIKLRSDYTVQLQQAFATVLDISGLEFPDITLRYRPSPAGATEGVDALNQSLEEIEAREIKLERPLLGPHRDELDIRWGGHPIRRVASAGERKALGLLLLASQGRILEEAGKVPLYLLDDADTELDATRLQALWKIFGGARQMFATSNRPQIWRPLDGLTHWSCARGVLTTDGSSQDLPRL